MDSATGEAFWISGVNGAHGSRHWAGSGKVFIEAAAVEEYLALVGRTGLDSARFVVAHDIKETDPADFVESENSPL